MARLLRLVEDGVGLVLMSAIWVVVLLQVAARLEGSSFPWTEELSRYVFIWICFVGASAGIRTREHAGMSFLRDWIGPKFGAVLGLVQDGLFLVFAAALCVLGAQFTLTQFRAGPMGSAVPFPLYTVSAAVPVGMALACGNLLRLIVEQVRSLRSRKG